VAKLQKILYSRAIRSLLSLSQHFLQYECVRPSSKFLQRSTSWKNTNKNISIFMLPHSDKQKIQSLTFKIWLLQLPGRYVFTVFYLTVIQLCAAWGMYWVVCSLRDSSSERTQRLWRQRALQNIACSLSSSILSDSISVSLNGIPVLHTVTTRHIGVGRAY